MDPDSSITKYLILIVLLVIINGFFSISQTAIVTLNDNKLKRMAADGNKRAKTVLKMTDEPSRFIATIQVGVLLCNLLACGIAVKFTGTIAGYLRFLPLPSEFIHGITLIVITFILCFFLLVFGDFVPKRIAMEFSETITLSLVPFVKLFSILLYPMVMLFSGATKVIVGLLGINSGVKPENVTEEEIRMMVDVGNETGAIEQEEKEMINNIFEFDDKMVDQVMTHRTELAAVEQNMTVREAIDIAVNSGHSRLPIYDHDIDTITGILYAKDLLSLVGNIGALDNIVKAYRRPALFIPESNRCAELLKTFKQLKLQLAIVVDEYGGTGGVVTMEDLLESIVGDIQDEYDNEEEEASQISESCFTFDGSISLDEVQKLLKIEINDSEDYDTLSGLLTDLLDRIPSADEHPTVTISGVVFTVMEMEDRRIAKIGAEILSAGNEEEKLQC
ncbi:MAG: hemolysin family protein [Oscillospiraceae bacterium]